MELTTVYQYFAANGGLIYVGITNRGTKRMHEHAESKPWWRLATGCTLEHYESRDEALDRERALIELFRPPYNDQHNPDRRPVEQRAAHLLQNKAKVDARRVQERRAAWLSLPKAEKRIAPCVRCGKRPGITGPECLNCRQRTDARREEEERIADEQRQAARAAAREWRIAAGGTGLASDHRRVHALAKKAGQMCAECGAAPQLPLNNAGASPSVTPEPARATT